MGNPPAAHGPFVVNFKGQLFRQGSGRIEVTSTEDPGVLQAPQHNPFLEIREVARRVSSLDTSDFRYEPRLYRLRRIGRILVPRLFGSGVVMSGVGSLSDLTADF